MPEGSAPEQKIGITTRLKSLVEKIKPKTMPKAPGAEFDKRGEAKGPFSAAKEPSKFGGYVITDTRTGKVVASLESAELAQRQADRVNAIEAIRKKLKNKSK